jgi:hypothetical protein
MYQQCQPFDEAIDRRSTEFLGFRTTAAKPSESLQPFHEPQSDPAVNGAHLD